MFDLSVKSNIAEAIRDVRATREQIPIASAKAMTFTAERVRDAEKQEINRVFDRPTPFTLSSLSMQGATPQRLEARVWFKDLGGYGGSRKNVSTEAGHYLEPQVYGGGRVLKQFERYLQRAGILPVGMFAVPGAGAKLDGFGNMSRGQLVQILSALGAAEHSSGYFANKSRRKGARFNKATALIFAGIPHPGMPAGVWMRQGLGRLKPLLIFVRAPRYNKRFNFYDVANTVADRVFPELLQRELDRATASLPTLQAA